MTNYKQFQCENLYLAISGEGGGLSSGRIITTFLLDLFKLFRNTYTTGRGGGGEKAGLASNLI